MQNSFYSFNNIEVFFYAFRVAQGCRLTFRGLKIVAKNQHQAFTNIHKTLNLATAPFQKFPKLAIFLNRCCVLPNIF